MHDAAHPLMGKVALVTGAAHPRGIGQAACRRLAELGARVVATDIDEGKNGAQLDALVASAVGRGEHIEMRFLDVRDSQGVTDAFAAVEKKYGGLDILFNNAGLAAGVGPFLDISDEQWGDVWDVNVRGIVRCCRAAIQLMIARGGGAIVNNASIAGLGAVPEMAGYTATKFAVIGLTKSIAAEFGPAGIRCNAVCPGTIRTRMYEQEVEFLAHSGGKSKTAAMHDLDQAAALRRAADASEVADVVAFLASPQASYVTGVALPVAGGAAPGL